jgi:4'-phosphopantetheinyl transferase
VCAPAAGVVLRGRVSQVAPLRPGEVQVVHVALDAVAGADRFRPLLSADERARADRFRFAPDRTRFTVARGVLRGLLGARLGVAPAAVGFAYGAHGKPAIASPPTGAWLRFNVSHSGDVALVALARDRDVGVDVERIRPDVRSDDLARRFFSPRENAVLAALPDEARRLAFFRIWTAKEAFVKATGEGVARGLAGFDVVDAAGAPQLRLDEPAQWSLRDLSVAPGYAAAVVAEGVPDEVVVVPWAP